MAHSLRITDPAELSDLATKLSNLNMEDSRPSTMTLVLLHPLLRPEVLAPCRNPESKFTVYDSNRRPRRSIERAEVLKIPSLAKLWRAEWSKLSTPYPLRVIFDVALPELSPDDPAKPQFKWPGRDDHPCDMTANPRDVQNLIITLATSLRMRVGEGGEVEFDTENVPTSVWRPEDLMKSMLANLSTRKKDLSVEETLSSQ